MRLIDADALRYEPLQKGDRNYRTYNLDDAYEDGYSDAFVDIRNAPTVDAVEVVRCKDCKHYLRNKIYVVDGMPLMGNQVCEKWGDGCRTDENGFCFMGERREANGNSDYSRGDSR